MSRYVREKQKAGRIDAPRRKDLLAFTEGDPMADYCMRCLGKATGWFQYEASGGVEGAVLPICLECNARFEGMADPVLRHMFVQGMVGTLLAYAESRDC